MPANGSADLRAALDALTEHGRSDPAVLRDLLEAVLVLGQGLELSQALQRIVDVAAEVLDAQYAALGVRGPDGGLRAFVYTGLTAQQRGAMGSLPVGRGVLGVLLKEPGVQRIRHLSDHPESIGFPPGHPPMDTFLGAPIIVRGSVFGSIYLTEKRHAPAFTELDETLIGVLAVAAGIAVDNSRLFERARTRHRWMQILARRGSEPLAGIALADTLNGLCADVATLTGATDVFVVTGPDDGLSVRGHTGRPPDPVAALPRPSAGTGYPAEEFPEWARDGADWISVQPLQRAAGPFGALLVTHPDRPIWEEEDEAGLTGVAEVVSLAVAYADQQQIARDLEALEDRHRIARDLHDHVIQRLFAIGMSLQTMQAAAPETAGERLEQIIGDLDRTIAQIRTSIFDLESPTGAPTTATLRRRVLDTVAELTHSAPVTPAVSFRGLVDTVVPANLGPHVDAVIREGLSNALRHSGAEHIAVTVSAEDDVLTVEIDDDGVGIPGDASFRGLANLTRRAEECDGIFTITGSRAGTDRPTGTVLTWSVPLHA